MKTMDLGLPDNLDRLNYLVGKITKKEVFMENKICLEKLSSDIFNVQPRRYNPCSYAQQCFEATPKVFLDFEEKDSQDCNEMSIEWSCVIRNNDNHLGRKLCTANTELIARCLALVYSVYGDEVPEIELEIKS